MPIKSIKETVFTSDLSNSCLGNIRHRTENNMDSPADDVSFISTLRALLMNRIPKEEIVDIDTYRTTYSKSALSNATPDNCMGAIFSDIDAKIGIIYISPADRESADYTMELIRNHFINWRRKRTEKEYSELIDLSLYLKRFNVDAQIYTCEETKSTVIAIVLPRSGSDQFSKFHILESLIPRFLPWYFREKPLTELEFNLLSSLHEKRADNYIQYVNQIAENFDFRSYEIEQIVGGFYDRYYSNQILYIKREIEDIDSCVEDCFQKVSSCISHKNNLNIRLIGLENCDPTQAQNEVLDLFRCNSSIDPISSYDNTINFIVRTQFDSFDPEAAITILDNEHSYAYRNYNCSNPFRQLKDRKLLLKAIFSDDPRLILKTCSIFKLNMSGEVSSFAGYAYPAKYKDYLRNPHLHYYNCFGDHKRYILDRVSAGDIVGAIMQCVESAKSINILEAPTFGRLVNDLFNSQDKVILLPDGSSVTPAEALEWLKKEEEN